MQDTIKHLLLIARLTALANKVNGVITDKRQEKTITKLIMGGLVRTILWGVLWYVPLWLLGDPSFLMKLLWANLIVSAMLFVVHAVVPSNVITRRMQRQKIKTKGPMAIFGLFIVIFFMPTALLFAVKAGDQYQEVLAGKILRDDRATLFSRNGHLIKLVEEYFVRSGKEMDKTVMDQVWVLEQELLDFSERTGELGESNEITWPETEPFLRRVERLIDELTVLTGNTSS
jgi:hypothetical protein